MKVELYTKFNCKYSDDFRKYLSERKINFQETQLLTDEEFQAFYTKMSWIMNKKINSLPQIFAKDDEGRELNFDNFHDLKKFKFN